MVKYFLKYLNKVSIVEFKNCNRQIKIPFVIYADSESLVVGNNSQVWNSNE